MIHALSEERGQLSRGGVRLARPRRQVHLLPPGRRQAGRQAGRQAEHAHGRTGIVTLALGSIADIWQLWQKSHMWQIGASDVPHPTYAELLAAGPWQEIPSCPGRLVWRGTRDRAITDSIGPDAPVQIFRVAAARDPVHVVSLDDGGLISYRQPDGGFVHTLNTPEGFARKLAQLGIALERGKPDGQTRMIST